MLRAKKKPGDTSHSLKQNAGISHRGGGGVKRGQREKEKNKGEGLQYGVLIFFTPLWQRSQHRMQEVQDDGLPIGESEERRIYRGGKRKGTRGNLLPKTLSGGVAWPGQAKKSKTELKKTGGGKKKGGRRRTPIKGDD